MLGSWVESSSLMRELKTVVTLWISKHSAPLIQDFHFWDYTLRKAHSYGKSLMHKDVQHSLVYKSKTTVQLPNIGGWLGDLGYMHLMEK